MVFPAAAALTAALVTVATSSTGAEGAALGDEPAPPSAEVRVAVLPLLVEGLTLNEVRRLDVLVRARVETRGGLQVQAPETTHALVDSAQALGLDCELRVVACAARLGRLADVSFVIAGEAVALGDEVGLEMRVIDVEEERVRREVRALLPADPDAQLEPLGAFFAALFDDGVALGALALDAEPAGATVLVDGLPATVTGGAPKGGLLPGEHVVVAQKDGYLPTSLRLTLAEGAPTTHTLRLEVDPSLRPEPPTLLEIALPLVAAGAGVVATGLGVAATVSGAAPWLAFQQTQAELFEQNQTRASYPADAQRLQGELQRSANEWNDSGRYWAAGGATLTLVGLAGTAGATAWSAAVLTRAFDAAETE